MSVRIDTTQPTQSTAITPQTPPQQTTPPAGISSQPTTITPKPAGCCSCTPFFTKIGNCFRSIGNFFRSGCVTILGTIGGLINYLTSCVRKAPNPREPSSNGQALPNDAVETPQATQPEPVAQTPIQLPDPAQLEPPPGTTVQTPSQIPGPARATPLEPTINAPLTPPPAADLFSLLPISPEEKGKIHWIIHTLGTTWLPFLLLQQPSLLQLGREIEHVHPLKFLEHILLDSALLTDLDTIHNDSNLWTPFLEGSSGLVGLSGKLDRERVGLPACIPGFARSMQIDPAMLEPFLNSGDWGAMVTFLLNVKLGRIVLPSPPLVPPSPPATQAPVQQPNPSQPGASPATQALAPQPNPSQPGASPATQPPAPQPTPSRPGASPAIQPPAPQSTPPRPRAPSTIHTPPTTPIRSVASLQPGPSRALQRSLLNLRSSTAVNFQSPQRLRAPVLTAWQEIALSDFHKELVTQIIETHQNMGYYGALRGDWNVASLWSRLRQDQVHPLALLAHLFTTPEYAAKLDSLWTYRMHRRYFVSELAAFLNQRPKSDYLPHIADFSQAVRKEEPTMIAHIHFQKWSELIDLLNRTKSPYLA